MVVLHAEGHGHLAVVAVDAHIHKVDHIPLGSAAEAEEIMFIQLQARMPVIVERAASHAVAVDFQPVVFGGLLHADRRLDCFIDCHGKASVHSILKARNTRRDWQVLRSFYYGYDGS